MPPIHEGFARDQEQPTGAAGAGRGSHSELPPSLLVLIGSTWSALACAIGALVVALATWKRSDWVFPSVLSALVSFALPALAAVAWRAFGQRGPSDAQAAERGAEAELPRLRLRIGPEEWSEAKLPCFSMLPRLQRPTTDMKTLRPSLLRKASVRTTVQLQPGARASVPIRAGSSRPPMVVVTPKRHAAISATISVRSGEGPGCEPEVSKLLLELHAPLTLLNVVPTLVNLHHIVENLRWALFRTRPAKDGAYSPASLAERAFTALVTLGQVVLMAAELVATVQLTRVSALPRGRGRHLALCFTGRLSMLGGLLRIPFWSVRLPDMLLPSPHGQLVRLLTRQPLASAVIRNPSAIPVAKFGRAVAELVSGFEVSAEVVVEVPMVDVEVCLPDATVIRTTARLGDWTGPLPTVRASASATGRLSRGGVHVEVQSMKWGDASMSGSVEATSAQHVANCPPLLEALLQAFVPAASQRAKPVDGAAADKALALVSSEWHIREGSMLSDVYWNMTVHHPLMKCGHRLWGAARGPSVGGTFAVRRVEVLHAGRCACTEPPVGDLRLACMHVEIPIAEPDAEPSVANSGPAPSSSGACASRGTKPLLSSPRGGLVPASTFRTGSTVTALSLAGGRVDCRLCVESGSKATVRVEYGCCVSVDTEVDIGYFPELGVPWSETLQGQANLQMEGTLLTELDASRWVVELLPATCIFMDLSDTAVSLDHRTLRVPDGSTVSLAVAAGSVGLQGLIGEPCLDVHWHCGDGKSPTLADTASELPVLELLGASFRNGSLRLRMNPLGRVHIENSPPWLVGLSPIATMLPAVSLIQQRDHAEKGHGRVADWHSISAWLDPLSPEGARRWGELLDSRELEEKVLLLCCILAPELQPIAKRVFTQIRRLIEALQEEGITGLRDIIPAEKLALVLSRMLSSDSSAGKDLFPQLFQVVKSAVEANGLDIPVVKEIVISHVPLLEDYPFELDRVLRILHLTLAPTPPMPPIAGQYAYPVARRQQHQHMLRGLPSAAEIYSIVDDRSRPLQTKWVGMLATVAPLLTCPQLQYVLSRRSDWPCESLARLTYVFELKKRVKQLSADWGGVMHLPQTHMIALFLGNVMHASLRWPERAIDNLPHEAQFLAHLRDATGPKVARGGSSTTKKLTNMPKLPMALVQDSFAQKAVSRVGSSLDMSPGPSNKWQGHRDQVLSGSLLGPEDVAALLRIALANITQSYVDQENFRMLLELTLSQPPNFLRGVLYELSDNGSQRNLTQVLLRLVDVRQEAFQTRIDIAALFESHLGIAIPRRLDYVAGGRWCRQSYYQEMFHAAAMVLEEAEPYLAVKSHVQVALPPEEMLSCPGAAGLDKGLTPGVEAPTKRAMAAIRDADERARAALRELRRGGAGAACGGLRWARHALGGWLPAGATAPAASSEHGLGGQHTELAAVTASYRAAFAACCSVLRQETPVTLGREWFRTFWQRNHEALMVECLVRAVQENVDSAREWLAVQPGMSEKALAQHQWGLGSWDNEQWLLDCIIDTTYFFEEDRECIRSDPLVRLLIANDPAERYDFTVISVMGVVSQGAKGMELDKVYRRYEARRGVIFVRADTGTAKSHEYNAAKVEEAIRKVRTRAWGIVGYSQGGANALKAESNLCGGTPEQRALVGNLACRNFLFPAANGAVQATCGEWKVTRIIVECEKLLKHYQASVSSAFQEAFLDLLWTLLSSRGLVSFIGGFHSLSHQGVQTLWREAQHKDGVPTTNLRGVVEEHTLPESLELMAAWHSKQLESPLHDTQVALDEAMGHPVHVHNANSAMLARCDLGGAVQRMSHWAPLDEATEFITTESDVRRRIYDIPKDRFIYPWIELNARFGFVPKVTAELEGSAAAAGPAQRGLSFSPGTQLQDRERSARVPQASGKRQEGAAASSAPTEAAHSPRPRQQSSSSSPRVAPSGGDGGFWKGERTDSHGKLSSLVQRQRSRSQRHRHRHSATAAARSQAPGTAAGPLTGASGVGEGPAPAREPEEEADAS